MSIRLSRDEAWERIERSHTGILTTLRADGHPITLPVWFVAVDRQIYVSTPPTSKKVSRARRDPRASFLVESGELWRELAAVHLTGELSEVDDETIARRVREKLDAKYAAFRVFRDDMPAQTSAAYQQSTLLRFSPDDRVLSWDNTRIRIGT